MQFILLACDFVVISNTLPNSKLGRLMSLLFNKDFVVLVLIFRSLISFELNFVYHVRLGSISFSCPGYPAVQHQNTRLFFPHLISCSEPVVHKCKGLFLEPPFYVIDLYLYPYVILAVLITIVL